jgi:hypothetical protein
MRVGRHSLHYLLDTDKTLATVPMQVRVLDDAVRQFFEKYSMNPGCPVAAKMKDFVEIEFHPLKIEGLEFFGIKQDGIPVEPNGAAGALPDAMTLETKDFKYHIYFTGRYLTKGFA